MQRSVRNVGFALILFGAVAVAGWAEIEHEYLVGSWQYRIITYLDISGEEPEPVDVTYSSTVAFSEDGTGTERQSDGYESTFTWDVDEENTFVMYSGDDSVKLHASIIDDGLFFATIWGAQYPDDIVFASYSRTE